MARIGIRNDLQMPLGKEVSQCAHALCAYVLGLRDFERGVWRVEPEALDRILAELTVERLPPEEMAGADLTITDAGHTVFGGVPTVTTCLFVGPQDPPHHENPHERSAPTDVRMVLCATKPFRKGAGAAFLKLAAAGYANHLRTVIDSGDRHRNGWLDRWRAGAFAKITLNATAEQIADTLAPGEIPSSVVAPGCVVLGPAPRDALEPRTGAMRLL